MTTNSKEAATIDMSASIFFTLPLELRRKIYNELLYHDPADNKQDCSVEDALFDGFNSIIEYNFPSVGNPFNKAGMEQIDESDEEGLAESRAPVASIKEDEVGNGGDGYLSEKADGEKDDFVAEADYTGKGERSRDDLGSMIMPAREIHPSCTYWQNRKPHDVHPKILRVSKQIHDEAVSILYQNVVCQIALPRILHDPNSHDRLAETYFCCFSYDDHTADSMIKSWSYECREKSGLEEIMDRRCLRSMLPIVILTSWSEIFGQPSSGPWARKDHCLTTTGKLLLDILHYISADPMPRSKRLQISIQGGCPLEAFVGEMVGSPEFRPKELDMHPGSMGIEDGLKEIIQILRKIRSNRSVLVTEAVWVLSDSSDQPQYVRREVDLESFSWILDRPTA